MRCGQIVSAMSQSFSFSSAQFRDARRIRMTQTPQTDQSVEHLNPNRINGFIDDELPLAERQEIEQHLASRDTRPQ